MVLSLSRGLNFTAACPRGGAHVSTSGQHRLVGAWGPSTQQLQECNDFTDIDACGNTPREIFLHTCSPVCGQATDCRSVIVTGEISAIIFEESKMIRKTITKQNSILVQVKIYTYRTDYNT